MKIVVITGASRGIGRALAEKFLAEGYDVIGTSTSGESTLSHDRLTMLTLDLSKPESIVACVNEIASLDKSIDILVNNAGIWSGDETATSLRMEHLRKVMEVNLFGTVDFTEKMIPLMHEGGHIVNVSSRAGSIAYAQGGQAKHPDYNISKVALNMATVMLAIRLKGKVTVSAVHPGWVQTDMGGSDADLTPEESADDIYKLAVSQPETGQFWFKDEKFPW